MTDFRIRVIVDPSGAVRGTRQVEGQLNRMGNAATRVQRLIARAFAFGGAAIGIRTLIQTADAVTNLENRLRLLTSSSAELESVMASLYRVANSTRSSFEATGTIYTRVGLAARELGVTQQQLLRFTKSLNQAVILSGASAREAEFALIQLSQGLASGTLRGDELRSVLEQLPAVADVIAEGLGVTRGELRKLGAEGKITARDVLDAFEKAAPRLAEAFAKTVPTISQSFMVLRNEATRLVAALDDALGNASGALANAILGLTRVLGALADNAGTVVRALEVFTVLLATRFIAGILSANGAIGRMIGQLIALEFALGATTLRAAAFSAAIKLAQRALARLALIAGAGVLGPVGAAVAAVTGLLYVFADGIKVTSDGVVSLGDVFRAIFSFIVDLLRPVVDFFKDIWQNGLEAVGDYFGDWGQVIVAAITAVVEFAKTMVNSYIGLWVGAVKTVIGAWNLFPEALRALGVAAINGLIDVVDTGLKKLVQGIGNFLEWLGQAFTAVGLDNPFAGLFDNFQTGLERFRLEGGRSVSEIFAEMGDIAAREFDQAMSTDYVGTGLMALIARAKEIAEARAAETGRLAGQPGDVSDPTLPGAPGAVGARSSADLRTKLGLLSDITAELEQEGRLLRMNNDQREVENRLLDIQRRAQEKGIRLSQAELAAIREKAVELQRLEQAMTFVGDVSEAIFGGLDDAVAEFIRTGEFNFKQFATNVVAELARIATQALLIRPLIQGLTSFLGGGQFTFIQPDLGSLFGFQHGGSVVAGGSGGPDSQLFVSKVSPGERIDFTPEGEGSRRGGNAVTINFNITTPDVEGFKRSQSQLAATAARLIGSGKRNL